MLQIDINNQIYLIFAKNTLQVVINVSEKLLTNKRRLYIRSISLIFEKRLS